MNKGIIYYTDNGLDTEIMKLCQKQLLKTNLDIVSVSLKPINFGRNIVLPLERGNLTLFKQILTAIKNINTDIIFFCEHDVIYHLSHFEFTPTNDYTFFYNINVWKVRYSDGHAVWTDDLQQVSGICVNRLLALDFYTKRVDELEKGYFNRHYEPNPRENWQSPFPNIDIRHDKNMTKTKWKPEDFRNQKYAKGWKETDNIPGWGKFKDFIELI